MNKLFAGIIVIGSVGFSLLLFGQSVSAQTFISREYRSRWSTRYENFGHYDLRRYPPSYKEQTEQGWQRNDQGLFYNTVRYRTNVVENGAISPVTYDQFGNFLVPGGEVVNMTWDRSNIGSDYFAKRDRFWTVFNNLVISSDEFSNWKTQLILSNIYDDGTPPNNFYQGYDAYSGTQKPGYGFRAFFTPSTLKQTNFRGFRWDLSSRKNSITLLANAEYSPTYGIHAESILGDIMKVGATFVGKQRGTTAYSQKDIISGSGAGRMRDAPRYVYVIVSDAQPGTTGEGAIVYDIKAFIDGHSTPIAFHGENYPILGRVFRIDNLLERTKYQFDKTTGKGSFRDTYIYPRSFSATSGSVYSNSTSPWTHYNDENFRGSSTSWVKDSILNNGNLLTELFLKDGQNGTGGLINIPTEAITGNISDRYDPSVPGNKEILRYFKADTSSGQLEAKGDNIVIYEFLVPYIAREISFNVLVSNDYNIDIAVAYYQYSQRTEADWYAAPLSSSWNGQWTVQWDSKHCVQAPGVTKDRSNMKWEKVVYNRVTGMNVYGMNMEMNWRGLFLRAEYNIYNSYWSYPKAETMLEGIHQKETSRAWFINAEKEFGKWSIGTELFNYPLEYMQDFPDGVSTVEDNDDDDRYGNGGGDSNDTPGMDADFDREIDRDISGAYFLHYMYDDIMVGDDFNHNGTIDSREDDTQPDYPYERDSNGKHFFIKFKPRYESIITIGHYDVRRATIEQRDFTRYFKLEHYQRMKGIGEYLFYQKAERIYKSSYPSMRNEWAFNTIVSTRLYFIPNLNIINNGQYETAYKKGILVQDKGTEQETMENLLSIYHGDELIKRYGDYNYSLEHKADYTLRIADAQVLPEVSIGGYRILKEKRIKEFKFMPMIKVVHSHYYNQPSNNALRRNLRVKNYTDIYPIIRLDYRVGPKTLLRFGVEGFPGFPRMYRTNTNKLNEYNQRSMVVAFENRSLYQGFNMVVLMGVRYSKLKWLEPVGRIDPGLTNYFITLQSESGGPQSEAFYHN